MENKLFLTPTEIHKLECMRPFPDFSATNLATASFYSKAQISKVLAAVEAKVEEAKKQQRLEDNRYYAEMIKKAVERVRIVATKRERERIFSLIDPYLQNMGGRDSKPQMWIMISERDWQGITAGERDWQGITAGKGGGA